MTLEIVLSRIDSVLELGQFEGDRRSLLHAYIACLSVDDLCSAIALTLDKPADVRLALRGRLQRLLGDGAAAQHSEHLVALIEETGAISDANKSLRPTVDALHSALIGHLPIPAQHYVLERWIGRGTRAAMSRWLKAARDTPSLFDSYGALAYWRASLDYRAAKSLAYQASPEALRPILGELVAQCEEGWIIAKAIIRSNCDEESIWEVVRCRHPATYLYLCAQVRRTISDDEAFDLAYSCPGVGIDGNRGLAIWAIGQMGKIDVLDRIRDAAEVLFEKDIANLKNRSAV